MREVLHCKACILILAAILMVSQGCRPQAGKSTPGPQPLREASEEARVPEPRGQPGEREQIRTHLVPPPPVTFHGPSTQLARSVVIPSLETPLPKGKNVIWCASFQLAWNRLTRDIVKGPAKLDKAPELVERLNEATVSDDDLPANEYYAAAGFVKDGIVDEILSRMQTRFHTSPRVAFRPTSSDGFVAYAYLQTRVPFAIPFFGSSTPMSFAESGGQSASVRAFGIRAEDEYAYDALRRQVQVLYASVEDENRSEQDEFVIDPCCTSSPSQVVIAHVPLGRTLAETIGNVRAKIASYPRDRPWRELGPNERLLIPTMNWEIEHEFDEMKGAHFLNEGLTGFFVESAVQRIRFRLDRGGAELETEAAVPCAPVPRYFYANGPFLVYVKRRDRQQPFFAMWVDNAELLCKPEASQPVTPSTGPARPGS